MFSTRRVRDPERLCSNISAVQGCGSSLKPIREELAITDTITVEEVVKAARGLDQDEFTRADVASALQVERPEIRDAFKAARKAGHLRKVSSNEKGKPRFEVTEVTEAE